MGTIYREGQSASTIKQAQQALADRGLLGQNNVTGTYDKATAQAIKTFKTNTNGSNTYGNTFGNETLAKLLTSPSGGSESMTSSSSTSYGSYASPQSVNWDSDAWKQAYIDTMVSQLQSNYNTDKANLDKTLQNNVSNYENQIKETDMDYDATIQNLYRQKYQDSQEAKNASFGRGLGYGGLGQAIEQTAAMNAMNNIAGTQNERTKAINNINTLINQAKYNYGIDADTLLKNFNADKLKYMSTAELNALEKQLEVDMYNTDWANKFAQDANDRQFQSSESALDRQWQSDENLFDRNWKTDEADKDRDWQTGEAQKDRDWKSGESALDRAAQSALSKLYNSSYSGSGSSTQKADSTLAANYLSDAGISTDNATTKKAYWDYIDGSISWGDFRAIVDAEAARIAQEQNNTEATAKKPSIFSNLVNTLYGGTAGQERLANAAKHHR